MVSVATDPLLIVSLAFWDALIVESALRCRARYLMSEDLQHGRRFGELSVHNPFRDTDG